MKTPSRSHIVARFAFAAAAAFFALVPDVRATTINWGTYISPTSYLFDSSGSNLDDSYTFELGSFGTFVPTEANMNDWLANWKPFDRATAPSTSGWNSASGIVAHSATVETDFTTSNETLSQANTFATGEQAYIWVYNTQVVGASMEWALVSNCNDATPSDDWTFPAPSGHVASSLDWRIEDGTFTPFGGLNNSEGPGSYSSTPTDFILQTHTVATVPEPGSFALVGLAGLVGIFRRRSRR